MKLVKMALAAALMTTASAGLALAQPPGPAGPPPVISGLTNLGTQKPEASLPFSMTTVATFDLPWRIAFLPDGRMLITEKVGPIWLVSQDGKKVQVAGTPPVYWEGQSGMMGVFLSPTYATDQNVYITYSEPGD